MPIPQSLITQQKAAQNALSTLAGQTAAKAVPDLSTLSQQQAGGVLRTVTTGTLNAFGTAATATGAESYAAYSDWAIESGVTRQTYTPSTVPKLSDVVMERVGPLVGYSMAAFSEGNFEGATVNLITGLSREVSNIYRQTIAFNSQNDNRVLYYQRVASPTACGFCALIAVKTAMDSGGEDFDGYHDHCGCSNVPVFKGDYGFYPDYYDDLEREINQATTDIRDYRAENPRPSGMKSKAYFSAFPDAAMNTSNIAARVRANRS